MGSCGIPHFWDCATTRARGVYTERRVSEILEGKQEFTNFKSRQGFLA
jgi:hypothetical protein